MAARAACPNRTPTEPRYEGTARVCCHAPPPFEAEAPRCLPVSSCLSRRIPNRTTTPLAGASAVAAGTSSRPTKRTTPPHPVGGGCAHPVKSPLSENPGTGRPVQSTTRRSGLDVPSDRVRRVAAPRSNRPTISMGPAGRQREWAQPGRHRAREFASSVVPQDPWIACVGITFGHDIPAWQL